MCFSTVLRMLSWREGQHSPAWGLLCISLWAQTLRVHTYNHIFHILTSNASEKAKEDLEIPTVNRFRKVHLSCSQPMTTAQMGPPVCLALSSFPPYHT